MRSTYVLVAASLAQASMSSIELLDDGFKETKRKIPGGTPVRVKTDKPKIKKKSDSLEKMLRNAKR
jgi:hypothetical protein